MSEIMASQGAAKPAETEGEQFPLEQAIDFMSDTNGGCFDPRHYHSFRGVSFLLPLRKCGVCSQRLQSVVPFSSNHVVQCLACRMLAHRTCAMSKDTEWEEPCPVNLEAAQALSKKSSSVASRLDVDDEPATLNLQHKDNTHTDVSSPTNNSTVDQESSTRIQSEAQNKENATTVVDTKSIFRTALHPTGGECSLPAESHRPTIQLSVSEGYIAAQKEGKWSAQNSSKAHFPFLSASSLFPTSKMEVGFDGEILRSRTWDGSSPSPETNQPLSSSPEKLQAFSSHSLPATTGGDEDNKQQSSEDFSKSMEWTAEGPPAHWATGKSLETFSPTKPNAGGETSEEEDRPLHFVSHPFASVSRALHENILAHFRPVVDRLLVKDDDVTVIGDATSKAVMPQQMEEEATPNELDGNAIDDKNDNEKPFIGAKEETAPVDVEGNVSDGDSAAEKPSIEKEVEGLLEETKSQGTDHRRLGIATVAGGIAGGVAGLVFAGPVGGVIGAKFGQTAGILGVVLEGSFTIGVITSGIAAGRHAGQQLQDRLDEKRVLALSGTGTNRGILLVRPSVQTDPAWAGFCEEAKRSHQKGLRLTFLPSDSKAAKRERYEREMDIVKTDEMEIPTGDKVFLLVSRILNNRESLPGHVYQQLIEKVKERAESRGPLSDIVNAYFDSRGKDEESESTEHSTTALIRARRQDAHAVIKYVTATLLELRPGFAASPSITEYTATAVEGLVFGEIYDLVQEEIEAEFEEKENDLLQKVAAFERSHNHDGNGIAQYKNCISEEALQALHHLPEAHSAVDKLRYCVIFLEKISEFFAGDASNGNKPMGADSLLKLVCQHIIAAKVFGINGQVAFLDEFARDEQLLRGKEGYALVTLQASLHFLNASTDFNADIFEQEDD